MISKTTYGNPFCTEAITDPIENKDTLKYFTINSTGDFELNLAASDIVYGLGEQVRGINKRGWRYVNWNFDNPHHQEDTKSLYGSHNFLVIKGTDSGRLFGVFFDYAGKITFDIGYTRRDKMLVHPESMDLDVYIIEEPDIKSIVKAFRKIIGKSYLPPLWAFGYGQSRWGYKNEEDIREVQSKYEELGIPLDSIYMDIDYMDNYKDFTVDSSRFPDLAALDSDMKDKGVHLVPIIDAGVKIEEGYDVYEEGVAKGYFCKNPDGSDFVGAVWPGLVHFPDFMKPEAREWFGGKYEKLTSLGIDGFWNDMNEPAIFYTPDVLDSTLGEISKLTKGDVGIKEYFGFTDMVAGLNGNEGYYDKFCHDIDGQLICHRKIHNLYGMNMTRSAFEALKKINPDKRTLFFSRSSYVGAHRYGGIWQGDNKSWWSHILMGMQQLPALNMAGFLFIGSDVGGFGSDTTEDLMMRWLQFAMFTPLMRNHSADGTRRQELYQFSNVKELGKMIEIRYSLIPYLYSEFLKAYRDDLMMFRPLAFDFEGDEDVSVVEDQLLIGDELMIAPIYKQNAKGRYVYLPEDMMLVRMRSTEDYETEVMTQGHHYVKADLNELIFFIRKGKAVPMCKPCMNTTLIDMTTIKLVGFEGSSYELYGDDGISMDAEKSFKITILK